MSFKKFIRTKVQADEPVISIGDNRFQYSAIFSKLAQLDKFTYVEYFINEEHRKIGFKFFKDSNSRDCYALGRKGNNYRSAAAEIIKRCSWVAKVANSNCAEDRKYIANNIHGMWVIQLSPSFETRVSREDAPKSLPNDSGIYRYLNENGEVVYIGKGNIKNRYMERERAQWLFKWIEYSIITIEDEQYEWESYWLERFKELSGGYLPYYNKVSGHKPDKSLV